MKVQNSAYRPPEFFALGKVKWGCEMQQKTLKEPLSLKGIGLHSGVNVNLTINPAPADSGIVFRRVDVDGKPEIKALYSNIVDTRNCSCLGDKAGNLVSTIEHVMSALYAAGIDNALIDVDNKELPIMDGSAKVFFDALKKAEKVEQNAARKYLKIKKEVSFSDEKGNTVKLLPSDKLSVEFEIEFPSKIVGHQVFDNEITPEVFEREISPCRTFCEKYQVDYLQSVGLAKGGSLDNAVVLDGETVMNPGGLRLKNECVNHKVLDAVGDLYTSGYYILGRMVASKTGHFHSNELLKVLFKDSSNYEIV